MRGNLLNPTKPGTTTYRLLLIAALAVATYLATTELPAAADEINDKLGHFLAYFCLALLADGAFPGKGFSWHKWLPLLLYGLGIELIQSQIPYRQFSPLDLAANAGGLAAYGFLAYLIRKRFSS